MPIVFIGSGGYLSKKSRYYIGLVLRNAGSVRVNHVSCKREIGLIGLYQ